jgi:hypothetical protein
VGYDAEHTASQLSFSFLLSQNIPLSASFSSSSSSKHISSPVFDIRPLDVEDTDPSPTRVFTFYGHGQTSLHSYALSSFYFPFVFIILAASHIPASSLHPNNHPFPYDAHQQSNRAPLHIRQHGRRLLE